MPAPLLLDLTHTCHTQARTGIQRVARGIWRELGPKARAVTHDPYLKAWRDLETWELKTLSAESLSTKRSSAWPLLAQVRGRSRSLLAGKPPTLVEAGSPSPLFVPEVFSAAVASALPDLFVQAAGPRAALFHDAIALKFPELTPNKTVARFPAYLRELLAFDGIAANSDDSRDTLLAYWRWLEIPISAQPVVTTIALGTDLHPTTPSSAGSETTQRPTVLCVGSLEGRKNHVALLDACEALWTQGVAFELHLIGLVQTQTGTAALEKVLMLQASGRPLRYDGPVDDAALASAYAQCAFTVYPSLMEGFGLPVLESLANGKPCICSARGALGEATRGGGCLALKEVNAAQLAAAIARLLNHRDELATLASQARARPIRTWVDYCRDLEAWLPGLKRRE